MSSLPPPHPAHRVAFNPARDKLEELTTPPPDTKVLKRRQRRKRTSRWDRPPEPHDWRWVVGGIGRLFITLGLLMFGFVAYQLWGTGIQEAHSQDNLRSEMEQFFQEQGLVPHPIAPDATSITVATTALPTTTPVVVAAGETEPPTTALAVPVETVVPATTVQAVKQELPQILPGSAIAMIRIPKIGVTKAVVAGVSVKELQEGPGHFPNTPFPGQFGNASIAGHRTTYGGPFLHVDELRPGDDIEITTILGDSYLYKVTGSDVVGKNDSHVVQTKDFTRATLTLVTCTPVGTASHRLIVYADLQVERSSAVGEAVVNYGQDFVATVDPVLPVDETPTSTPSGDATQTPATGTAAPDAAADQASTSTDVAASATSQTAAPAENAFAASTDAFNQGWFADTRAWPHVAAWCAGLLVLWFVCHRIAKRFRRLWLGILIGIVPFVVLLYFFYENVNRLLPTAI